MAGKPIATVGSMHTCPMCSGTVPHVGGPIAGPGASNVLINGKPVAVVGDMCTCAGGPPSTIVQGEPSVLINGVPVATVDCMTSHGGSIVQGEPGVIIGSKTNSKPTTIKPIKRIPFPEITTINRIKAFAVGRSNDLRTAKQNMEQIKREAAQQPQITVTNLQWQKDDSIVQNTMVGEEVLLCADVQGLDDGTFLHLRIFEKDMQSEDDFVSSASGQIQNGSVEIPWIVKYIEDNDDTESAQEMQQKGYTMPEYVFKYDNSDGETVESGVLTVEDCLEIEAIDEETGEPLANYGFSLSLPDGDFITGELDENGYAAVESISASNNYVIVFYKDDQLTPVIRE